MGANPPGRAGLGAPLPGRPGGQREPRLCGRWSRARSQRVGTASLLRRPPHANKKETFSEMPKGRGRVHTGHTVRRASAAQCDRRADRRPAARGAGYAFAASVSSFTPTHACPYGNASVSFVRSETALEITASMSLTMCFLIRHGQLPARRNTGQRRGDAARTRRAAPGDAQQTPPVLARSPGYGSDAAPATALAGTTVRPSVQTPPAPAAMRGCALT